MSNNDNLVIGIDLGTTNSCVAYYKNEQILILENAQGDRTTPSIVYYKKATEIIVEKQSKRLIKNQPKSGVNGVKRLIGKSYDDPSIQELKNSARYGINNNNGEIELEIQLPTSKGDVIKQTPEQISSQILKKLKLDSEEKLNQKISNAVITIPAYFNVRQREATLKAGQLAGFNVLKLLTEPTAAALSYFHQVKDCPNNKYYLVYDLGGGTFDVSILQKTENEINVVGIDGDVNLGGYNFDRIILQHVTDIVQEKYGFAVHELNKSGRLMKRIENECEEAKMQLSTQEEVSIIIEKPQKLQQDDDDDEGLTIEITRTKFEEICSHLFDKTIKIVENCLKGANISKYNIEEVILCGGSTRIPKIQEMLKSFFGGKQLQKINNLDECVAEGAALQAAMLSKSHIQSTVALRITDVVSLSIGVGNFVDQTYFVIKRNTPLPARGIYKSVTYTNNQKRIIFTIYEGERLDANKNYYLGSLTLDNLTPAPPGQCEVELTLMLNQNGILTCTATETVCNNTSSIEMDYNRHRNDATMNSSSVDAKANEEADKFFKEFSDLKSFLRRYCIRFNYNVSELNLMRTYENVYDYCKMLDKSVAKMTDDNYKQLRIVKSQLLDKCASIVNTHKFKFMPME